MINDFDEHIRLAMEAGRTEEQALQALGPIRAIVRETQAEYALQHAETHRTPRAIFRAVGAMVGLGAFNLLVVAVPFIILICVLITLYAVSIGFLVAPVAGLVGIIIGVYHMGYFFPVVLGEGFGLLLLASLLWVTKKLYGWFLNYLRMQIRYIRGGETA